jgi:hypothetical protein
VLHVFLVWWGLQRRATNRAVPTLNFNYFRRSRRNGCCSMARKFLSV